MKRIRIARIAGALLLAALVLAGCAGTPEPLPPAVPRPAPEPAISLPEPTAPPEPEIAAPPPRGHAPLVGTVWQLEQLHGDMRTLVPPRGQIKLEFLAPEEPVNAGDPPAAPRFVATVPTGQITGTYQHRHRVDSPREAYNFEEGTISAAAIDRARRVGSFSEFEDVLEENMAILKGYYISGETPESSRLTIWGGFRSEEVLLLELTVAPGL